MFKIKNLFYILLVCMFLIATNASCSDQHRFVVKNYDDNDQKNQKITLRFISSWGGVDAKADTLQKILDQFMEDNPNIKVINESLYGEDFLPKIKTDFVSGNDPDVFDIWPGSDIEALIKANKVADLTDILINNDEWKNSFNSEMWDYTTYNKRIYGLPFEKIYEGLFINKGLFEVYNVKVPTTYEELKDAIKIFKQNDVIPIAYNCSAEGTYIYQNIAAMLGGKDAIQHPIRNGKVNPAYIQAMKYMQELYNLGAFPYKPYNLSSKDRDYLFLNKKAAMIVQGSWFIGRVSEEDRQNGLVDIIPFPAFKEGKASNNSLIYGLGNGVLYISKAASSDPAKKEAAIKLLKVLTSKRSAALFAEQTGMYSNVDITGYNVNYCRLAKKGEVLLKNAKELIGPPDNFVNRKIWNKIVDDFPRVLGALVPAMTPEEAWNRAIAELENESNN